MSETTCERCSKMRSAGAALRLSDASSITCTDCQTMALLTGAQAAITQLDASWAQATAEADAWRSWAAKTHGAPLSSDAAARAHVDDSLRFVNEARAQLQSRLVQADTRVVELEAALPPPKPSCACGAPSCDVCHP